MVRLVQGLRLPRFFEYYGSPLKLLTAAVNVSSLGEGPSMPYTDTDTGADLPPPVILGRRW